MSEISINTDHIHHCIHLPQLIKTDLTKKLDLVLTNLIGKDGVQCWSIYENIYPIRVSSSIGGWPTETKEAPFAHEVRLIPPETNPVF